MVKDFAKNKRKRSSASRLDTSQHKITIPNWTWALAAILTGVIVAVVLVINQNAAKPAEKPAKPEVKSAKLRYKAVPAEKSDDDFDFHNILHNKVVEVPTQETISSLTKKANKIYIMQCGSFSKISSAESLKAKIAMNGFTASIKASDEKSGKRWYRVSLGPYKSKRRAESQRHQLERNNINQCKIW